MFKLFKLFLIDQKITLNYGLNDKEKAKLCASAAIDITNTTIF